MAIGPRVVGGWHTLLKGTAKGKRLMNFENIRIVLQNDPALRDMFGYNEMTLAPTLMHPLGGNIATIDPMPLRDNDFAEILGYIQATVLANVSYENVRRAILLKAEDQSFHPIRDELKDFEWDGQPRVDSWLSQYMGVPPTDYSKEIGKRFLISLVKRVFEPGCQMDYMLTLEGKQGIGKSSALRMLVGDEYFSDSLPDISDVRAVGQHLRGKWLVEIAELNRFNRAEANAFKDFLVRRVEQYRPAYGYCEVREPRQCIFAATTNSFVYLKDDTGNRRIWPERCIDPIRLHGPGSLEENRDMLLAEAMVMLDSGEKSYPSPEFEKQHITPQQEARYSEDALHDKIKEYLDTNGITKTRPSDIATALGLEISRHDNYLFKRISSELNFLGYERDMQKSHGYFWWRRK